MAQLRPRNTEVPRSGVSKDSPLVTYDTNATPASIWTARKWRCLPMRSQGGATITAALWSTANESVSIASRETLQSAQRSRGHVNQITWQHHLGMFTASSMEACDAG
jgi:hypothetical protein